MSISEPMTFLHLSDLHLTPPGELVSGVDTGQQVRAVLAYVRERQIDPAFIVISGDLTEDGRAESYERLKELLPEMGGGIPVLLALGNHDNRGIFRQVVLGETGSDGAAPYCHSQVIDGLRVIVLDSHLPGQAGGALGDEQLTWLAEQLAMPAPRGTVIALHHCCRLAGPAHHFPAFILRDAPELEALVAQHPGEMLGILAGHSHQANAAPFGGTLHATAPAIFCQLDFFQGPDYVTIPGAGFNLCQIRDGQLVVVPVRVGG